jgi:hypothetical protein
MAESSFVGTKIVEGGWKARDPMSGDALAVEGSENEPEELDPGGLVGSPRNGKRETSTLEVKLLLGELALPQEEKARQAYLARAGGGCALRCGSELEVIAYVGVG